MGARQAGALGTLDPHRRTDPVGLRLRRRASQAVRGVADMPIGVDIIEPPMMFELQKAGLNIVDGQQIMLEAREIKSQDEIALLNHAAAMLYTSPSPRDGLLSRM